MRLRRRPLRPREQVLGRRAPGDSFLHRAPAGAKVLVLALVTVVVLLLRDPLVGVAVVGLVLGLTLLARIPVLMLLVLIRRLWIVLAVLAVLQWILNDPATGTEVLARILACLLAAQLLLLTTDPVELVGVLRRVLQPLRFLGLRPGRVALAALIMLRAVPYLADSFHMGAQQARARGLERDLRARTVPLLLGAVDHARNTGRALNARGIEEA
ncbi:CbiQ family ECF transporter T component [Nesterenkonia haasae]|uniref:CbiQ family ECF transporter T component n=1 Tax=Nesterenkonia haasae TaxID=2587813 RepID=UPI0013915744|nr:CbiQ family ECF transporter T component [Nesterenkonia haasae]NDK31050.1 energy-coupling factor transporter transmembrane protein EcfT [Nesterenkonia haasae]